jgi:hypothetical protein
VPIEPSPRYQLTGDDFGAGVDLVLGLRAAARAAGLTLPDKYSLRRAVAAAEELLTALGTPAAVDPDDANHDGGAR